MRKSVSSPRIKIPKGKSINEASFTVRKISSGVKRVKTVRSIRTK